MGFFDIFRINDFWKKFISSSNLIIKMYSRFIKQKADDLNTTFLPTCYNPTKWEGFFRNYIEVNVNKKREQLTVWTFVTRYGYTCFGTRKKHRKDGFPYLEIRDRDCFDNKFGALILRYHPENVKIDEEKEFKKLRECIKKAEDKYDEKEKVFSLQGTIKKNKQIAKFVRNDVKDREEFLRLTLIAIDRYLEITNEYVMDEITED